MNKNGLKAIIERANRLGCGTMVTDRGLSVFRITNEAGIRRTTTIKVKRVNETGLSDREKWESEFNQLTPALELLSLKPVYTENCVKLAHSAEEMLDEEFYYRPGEPERMANYLSTLYLESIDGNGATKIRPRYWEDTMNAAINKELDIFEANAAKSVEDYKKLAERLWCRLSATEQEGCFRDFSGEIKQRLMEVMARLR